MAHSDFLIQKLEKIEQSIADQNLCQKEILTHQEAAAYLGLQTSYLYKLTSSKQIPFYKPQGKRIFYRRKELEDWLLRNRQASREEIEQEAANYVIRKK